MLLPGSPLLWLAIVGLVSGPATYGVMKVQEARKWRIAYDQGVEAGKGISATATVAAATDTARAEREAEATISPVPAKHEALVVRCNKDRACRDRGKF